MKEVDEVELRDQCVGQLDERVSDEFFPGDMGWSLPAHVRLGATRAEGSAAPTVVQHQPS
jgi:hypothetical protein